MIGPGRIFTIGVILVLVGLPLLSNSLLPVPTRTVVLPPGYDQPLTNSRLSTTTLTISWSGLPLGTTVFLVSSRPTSSECSFPMNVIDSGTGSSGSFTFNQGAGVTDYAYGCSGSSNPGITFKLDQTGGLTPGEVAGAVLFPVGILFLVLWWRRRWGYPGAHSPFKAPPQSLNPRAPNTALPSDWTAYVAQTGSPSAGSEQGSPQAGGSRSPQPAAWDLSSFSSLSTSDQLKIYGLVGLASLALGLDLFAFLSWAVSPYPLTASAYFGPTLLVAIAVLSLRSVARRRQPRPVRLESSDLGLRLLFETGANRMTLLGWRDSSLRLKLVRVVQPGSPAGGRCLLARRGHTISRISDEAFFGIAEAAAAAGAEVTRSVGASGWRTIVTIGPRRNVSGAGPPSFAKIEPLLQGPNSVGTAASILSGSHAGTLPVGEPKLGVIPRVVKYGIGGIREYSVLLTDRRFILVLASLDRMVLVAAALGGALGYLAAASASGDKTATSQTYVFREEPATLASLSGSVVINYAGIQRLLLKKSFGGSQLRITYLSEDNKKHEIQLEPRPPADVVSNARVAGVPRAEVMREYLTETQATILRSVPPSIVSKAEWKL